MIDWEPVVLYVQVQDSDGNDLLDPENDNSWLEGTTVTYYGVVVDLDTTPLTKDVLVVYHGFQLEKYKDGKYALSFGEFNGAKEYKDAEFFIGWPDGRTDVITYSRKLNTISVKANEKWKLNGKECSYPVLIVK